MMHGIQLIRALFPDSKPELEDPRLGLKVAFKVSPIEKLLYASLVPQNPWTRRGPIQTFRLAAELTFETLRACRQRPLSDIPATDPVPMEDM